MSFKLREPRGAHAARVLAMVSSPSRTFYVTDRKIDMSTITEIQEAIVQLPANEKSALAVWLQSQEEPLMSEAEEAVLLARLDKAAAQLDGGEGILIDRVRKDIRRWAGK
jgi:phosphoglycerate-specific signal transduction histidine kinase